MASTARPPSPPRELPTAQPDTLDRLDAKDLIEEETFSWYKPDNWYPVKIGQVFESRYQVLLKLGFGSVSTAWLCRDLKQTTQIRHHQGVRDGPPPALNEFKVLQHLAPIASDHPGRKLVRLALESFELPGKKGTHICIVHEPLGPTLAELREMAGGQLPADLLKPLVYGMLLGLDYMHAVAHVVHTDIQEGNFMLSLNDHRVLDDAVNEVWAAGIPRKFAGDREVYLSTGCEVPDEPVPVISDFGDAKFGDAPFVGEVMPDLYRAPEIVLGIPWDEKIDIWAFGLMVWDLCEGKHLFNRRLPSREESSPAHLARIISLLGPPPPDLLGRGSESARFFDADGTFKHPDQVSEAGLESEEENLEGEEQAQFLAFIRRMLRWQPEDRASAAELLQDPWI